MTGNGRTVTLVWSDHPGTLAAYLNQALQKTRPAAVLFVVSSDVSAGRSAELSPYAANVERD